MDNELKIAFEVGFNKEAEEPAFSNSEATGALIGAPAGSATLEGIRWATGLDGMRSSHGRAAKALTLANSALAPLAGAASGAIAGDVMSGSSNSLRDKDLIKMRQAIGEAAFPNKDNFSPKEENAIMQAMKRHGHELDGDNLTMKDDNFQNAVTSAQQWRY